MVEGERRKKIKEAYVKLPHKGWRTEASITFVRGTCKCRSISHFLDTAKESNVERLERILFDD